VSVRPLLSCTCTWSWREVKRMRESSGSEHGEKDPR
jgi:hypothetical protein